MQYLGRSLQFLLELFVYDQPFDRGNLVGFAFVWVALVIYALHGLRQLSVATLCRGPDGRAVHDATAWQCFGESVVRKCLVAAGLRKSRTLVSPDISSDAQS